MATQSVMPDFAFGDGQTWTALAARQLLGGTRTCDAGSASAVAPLGGVFMADYAGAMQVTPGTGLSVLVGAGYCAIPHPTATHGCYIMGAMAQATLTIGSNSSGQTRVDLIVARIYDLETSGSYCDVEVVAGTPGSGQPATPSAALPLGAVTVANGASSLTTGNIADLRAFTAPLGCLPSIASSSAAPAVPKSQLLVNTGTASLNRGTGTSGHSAGVFMTSSAGMQVVNTSTGAQGAQPGTSGYPWGIGYGSIGAGSSYFYYYYYYYGYGGGDTDNTITRQLSVTWNADGVSDYEIHIRWGLVVPADAYEGHTALGSGAQCAIITQLDGQTVDIVYAGADDNPLAPGSAGSSSWYSSAAAGTTPSQGTHTASLAIETFSTQDAGIASGVFIGNTANSGATVFGAGSGYTNALVAENCLIRVDCVPGVY